MIYIVFKLYHLGTGEENHSLLHCWNKQWSSYHNFMHFSINTMGIIFSTLLDESVPLQHQPPEFKEGVGPQSIAEEIVYVWLNYR